MFLLMIIFTISSETCNMRVIDVLFLLQLSHTDDCFDAGGSGSSAVTSPNEICTNMRAAAQDLLNHYVRMQGLTVSQVRFFSNF